MDRHHIALIFYTLRDKRLLPRQVVDGSILALAAVQACRKHQHVVVTLEARLHHTWEIAALATRLVDADTYRFQTRQVEQKIIHQIAELAIIVLADDGTETYAVLSAQRMIGNKGIEFAVVLVRQVFQAYDFNIHLQIAHTFGETKYQAGQSLVFVCPNCNKQFGIRMGVSKLRETRKEEKLDENANEKGYGSIVVIENVFAYKQVIPLQLGDNIIGRYMKNSGINCPIETVDPSVDMNHCVINVSRDKKGKLKYVLRDGPSYTGTFVDNEILGDRERRIIEDGTLFTIGATSIILRTADSEEEN